MINAAQHRQHLLIVDDERGQLRTLSDIFTEDGFHVCGCSTPQQALEQCRKQSFAVAILDLRLHGQSGIDLLQQLRQLQPEIRTIIYTAFGSFDSAKDAVNLGAFAYVEKRGNPADLINQVHRAANDVLATALSASELRYRTLVDDIVAIVWECDIQTWRFTYVSHHAEAILGYPVKCWLEEPDFWTNHIHPDDRDRCIRLCSEHTARGKDHAFDYRAIAADGRIVWIHDIVHVANDDSENRTVLRGMMLDITEKKRFEERLREMETQLAHVSRLSTMGEMVTGIAHEINQPLSAISSFASACGNALADSDCDFEMPVESWLQQITQQALRCGGIIRGLREFVNKGDQAWEPVDLNDAIQEAVELIGNDSGNNLIEFHRGPSDPGPQVFGSKVQLQQVFVNLLRNALDATQEHCDPQIRLELTVIDGRVVVTVEDNGEGIKEDHANMLFDAFFTTKTDGMGVGLAISRSIIEAHHGSLDLDSDTTSGAKFIIRLPIHVRKTVTAQ